VLTTSHITQFNRPLKLRERGANMDEDLKIYVDKILDLYVSVRKKFIRQKYDGSYSHSYGFFNQMFLGDTLVKNHLIGTETIGVFSPDGYSKFITFDVDAEYMSEGARIELVKLVISELVEIGISRDLIQVNQSGSKGYHISIFISEMTTQSNIEIIYNYIIYSLGVSKTLIEMRPTNSNGLKLPLGINKKTDKRCWFLDSDFNEIESFEPVLKITKMDRNEFQDVAKHIIDITEKEIEDLSLIYSEYKNTLPLLTIEYAMCIEREGIQAVGTRNYLTLQLAVLYNTLGYKKEESLEKLNTWINSQNPSTFSTPLYKCYKENYKIINWVYSKNIRFYKKENESIKLYKKEIDLISSVKNKKARHLLYSMICHHKRYYNISTQHMYMTHSQILTHTDIKNVNDISKLMKYLVDNKYIEIIRGNKFNQVNNKKLTNIYKINYNDSYKVGKVMMTINEYTNYMNNTAKLDGLMIL
jgi:hypothetical protein